MTPKNTPSIDIHTVIDAACIGFILLLLLVGAANPSRVQDWPAPGRNLALAALLYCTASAGVRLIPEGLASTWGLTAAVTLLLSFLYQAIAGFQHVFIKGWLDGALISCERSLTGTESTVFLQRYASPPVTEWMMFAYVIYVPLLPLTALLCYKKDGPAGARDFLLNLAVTNFACFAGFLLFPVAGPLFYDPAQYTVPLTGGLFTWCGRLLHASAHYPGGSLPSPHCAATTVMIVMLYRHNRKMFYAALPTLISVYAATVYGRYHYVWDSAAGILTAVLVLRYTPALARMFAPGPGIGAAPEKRTGIFATAISQKGEPS